MTIEKIKEIFNAVEVTYEVISDKEIAIPCPANYSSKVLLSQIDIINNYTTGCITDECWVHILEEENGELSWLVVVEE